MPGRLLFQSELYGPGDFSQRDADLARVVPIMIRVLPDAVVATVAMAMELSTLSHELDHALVGKLDASATFTVADYCDAYRACDNRTDRRRQIDLIVQTGSALDRYVRQPMLGPLLAMMRHPARIAGSPRCRNSWRVVLRASPGSATSTLLSRRSTPARQR